MSKPKFWCVFQTTQMLDLAWLEEKICALKVWNLQGFTVDDLIPGSTSSRGYWWCEEERLGKPGSLLAAWRQWEPRAHTYTPYTVLQGPSSLTVGLWSGERCQFCYGVSLGLLGGDWSLCEGLQCVAALCQWSDWFWGAPDSICTWGCALLCPLGLWPGLEGMWSNLPGNIVRSGGGRPGGHGGRWAVQASGWWGPVALRPASNEYWRHLAWEGASCFPVAFLWLGAVFSAFTCWFLLCLNIWLSLGYGLEFLWFWRLVASLGNLSLDSPLPLKWLRKGHFAPLHVVPFSPLSHVTPCSSGVKDWIVNKLQRLL